MSRRRLAIVGAVALVLAAGGGTAIAVDRAAPPAAPVTAQNGPAPAAAAAQPRAKSPSATGPRVVRPYQPVDIGRGAKMGLLPEGRQNYVVSYDDFAADVEEAKKYPGSSIRPNSLSGGIGTEGDDILFTGAYRTDTVPARTTVRIGKGPETEAAMLRLPGRPGWGTYYLDRPGAGPWREPVTVTAYDGGGAVLATLTFAPR
ncbi:MULTISPECIES: hypothetical protein [unclassified Streptomyces]|uniref:hypothetical protein n=1 Tax=unclassified Streptomyces TaxID=2593676 RepID=UPI0028C47D15|nr:MULTISPECIES: hypothetical protein [unclassified Streptomyces]WNO74475.1 hypothetical protein RPQ07_23965 [Streptomyces sp. AM8-1-1]